MDATPPAPLSPWLLTGLYLAAIAVNTAAFGIQYVLTGHPARWAYPSTLAIVLAGAYLARYADRQRR